MSVSRLTKAALGILAASTAVLVGASSAWAAPEAPETTAASGVTASSATLHGVLNPGGPSEGGGYRFTYRQSEGECEPEGVFAPELPALALGHEKEAVSRAVTGLEPDRPYTFCLVASNLSAETTTGPPVSFTTLALPPSIDGESVSGANSSSANLEAQVNANNEATTYSFEYATEASGEKLEGTVVTVAGGELFPGFGDQGAVANTGAALSEGTTYFYRVVAENEKSREEGEPVKGKVQSFTTVPVPHTDPVTAVTATSATFNGHLTLNPVDTTFSFAYNIGGECVNGPVTGSEDAGTGSASEAVSTAVTGLQPGSSYSVCLVSSNAFGQEVDPTVPPVSFTTPAAPPAVDGESASVTPFEATLEAQVNANNQATTYKFLYATNEAMSENVVTLTPPEGTPPLEGYGDQGVSAPTGHVLTPGTHYFYRVVAENAAHEKTEGAVTELTTLPAEAPSVEGGSEHAQGIGSRSVTLEANVDAHYQDTTVVFEYATSETTLLEGHGTKAPALPLTTFGGAQNVNELVEGLTPNQGYFFRVIASNATGTSTGLVATFTTLRVPLVEETTPEASEVTQHTALITNITVNPQFEAPEEPGEEPTYYIAYGETTAYDQTSPAPVHGSAGYGMTANKVPDVQLSGLHPGSTYHYAIVAHNPNGTETSQDHQFTTPPAAPFTTPPVIGNSSATFINETSAVIEGEVDPEGLPATYRIEYGTTPAYGASTPPEPLPATMSARATITALAGLQPATTYHYRLTASNSAGTSTGPDQTFTTTGALTGAFTPFVIPATPPITTAPFTFPPEEPGTTGSPKHLTNKQKLAKALKTCRTKHNHKKRAACEANARKRYRPKH